MPKPHVLLKFFIVAIGAFLAGCTSCCNTSYGTVVLTPPPSREASCVPQGYMSCEMVAASWHGSYWVPAHQVCQYQRTRQAMVWVDSYWRCENYHVWGNSCSDWKWVSGHWTTQNVLY